MAHVCAHSDFFKDNFWFSKTNRKMMDEIANHGAKIQKYMDKYGEEEVDNFIDVCLSVEDLIDYHRPFVKRSDGKSKYDFDEEDEERTVGKFKSKDYMDNFINPKEFLAEQKIKMEEEKNQGKRLPEKSEKDVLLFLIENAPMDSWKQDILSIVREEAYYFAPQGQTKIMNEGWSTYWHSKIMTGKVAKDSEIIDYADHHSGTLGTRPGRVNPYKIGVELFRDIETRWDQGKFGKGYEECESLEERRNWDRKLGLGREKIFEVRKIYNDVTFIDTFLTDDFCR